MVFLCLCTLVPISALTLDPGTRLRVSDQGLPQIAHSRDSQGKSPYIPLILKIDQQAIADSLASLGVIIYNQRADLLLTSVPRDSLGKVLALDGLIEASASGTASSCLDKARPFGGVDKAREGMSLPMGYKGDGVVVGFSDTGFDPNHIAFRGRVARLYNYDTPNGISQSAITPAEIEHWVTDNADEYHATHVGNILAGGYMGNPYYGVASEAELVATTSKLYDVGILAGVEDIIAYAKSRDKRAVVNLSLSSSLGPHDGTSLMCQYLSRCVEDAVICISAGNRGNQNVYASRQLAEGEAVVMVNTSHTWDGFNVSGYADLWSDSDAPFDFCFDIYDMLRRELVYSTPWVSGESSVRIDDADDAEFARYFSGQLYAECGWSRLNGRYNVSVLVNVNPYEYYPDAKYARYYVALRARHAADDSGDVRVNMYADASNLYFGGVAGGMTEIGSQCSINDFCTASGVISVGMACSRTEVPLLDGGTWQWTTATVDHIVKDSSYSDVPGVKRLPLISGPGYTVVSAISTPFLEAHPGEITLSAESQVDGKSYFWDAECGTSMSSPFVAGVVALWLQADPTLAVDDIIDIAISTASTDYIDISDPRWGAGCIDAYAGLREVIDRAGITDTVMPVTVRVGTDRRLVVDGVDPADVRVYSATGQFIDHSHALPPGVYIVSISDQPPIKILIR